MVWDGMLLGTYIHTYMSTAKFFTLKFPCQLQRHILAGDGKNQKSSSTQKRFLCQFYELRHLKLYTAFVACVYIVWFGQYTEIAFLVSLFVCAMPAYIVVYSSRQMLYAVHSEKSRKPPYIPVESRATRAFATAFAGTLEKFSLCFLRCILVKCGVFFVNEWDRCMHMGAVW